MNNKKRYLFGLISTLLLAIGFARAAERFDPMNPALGSSQVQTSGVAPDCNAVCNYYLNN
jgi:hypothetical protein